MTGSLVEQRLPRFRHSSPKSKNTIRFSFVTVRMWHIVLVRHLELPALKRSLKVSCAKMGLTVGIGRIAEE